jgi:2-methylcitrate dehydratase
MDDLSSRLAQYAATARISDLSGPVIQAATLRLVDSLACAMPAYECEAASIARRLARGSAPERYSGRILGFGEQTAAELAGFINTCMIRCFDWNDQYPSGHPSDCLGAILALAASTEASGSQLLSSMAVAYETYIRLNDATRLRQQGWDQGYIVGIATAAATGNLLGLRTEQIAQAISMTSVANVPMRNTRAGRLSLWKGAATAYAVRNGVFGALLAAEGMTGPDQPFEGVDGLWALLTGPFEIAALPNEGGGFRLRDVNMKYWPVEYNAQLAVWAGLKLRDVCDWHDIERIRIGTYSFAISEIAGDPAKWDPQTRETADHSMPYIMARTLVDGGINLDSFDQSAYLDPALRPLMAGISVEKDEQAEAIFPSTVSMRVTAITKAGHTLSFDLRDPLGHEKNQMQESEVRDKFLRAVTPSFGAEPAGTALEQWLGIAAVPRAVDALELLDLREPDRSVNREA